MAKQIDRSAFKATSVQTLKDRDKEIGVTQGGDASRLKIEVGSNIFRVYPPHPDGGGDSFTEAKVTHWLPMDVEDKKDGELQYDSKGKIKMKRISKPIFNSIIHGNTKKDIIDEYIKAAEKYAKDTYTKDDERKEYLKPVFGFFSKDQKLNVQAITQTPKWVMYADQLTLNAANEITAKKFGDLEIGKAVKFRLNAISASESSNEPLGTDPFSDIEEGRAINITYNDKAAKPQDYYLTEMFAPMQKGSGGKFTLYPLSDEDLEKFLEEKPLAKRFRNCYTRKDYDWALKGLKIIDDENNMGIFSLESFLDVVEEISAYYPEIVSEEKEIADMFDDKNRKTSPAKPAKVEATKEVKVIKAEPTNHPLEVITHEERDGFDDMDRAALIAFAKDEKTGIIVKPSLKDNEIRQMLRAWDSQQTSGEVPLSEETGKETQGETGSSTSKAIADMKAKLKKKE